MKNLLQLGLAILLTGFLSPADGGVFIPSGITPTNGFTTIGNVGGPFNITSQTYTLRNSGAANLSWSNNLTASTNWIKVSATNGTLAAFATTNIVVSLNSAVATNLPMATYTSSVVWYTNAAVIQSNNYTLLVQQPIIQNGDFETGDFTSWTLANSLTNDPDGFPQLNNFVATHDFGLGPFSGSYYAEMGQYTLPLATLTQTVPTTAGQTYALTFFLINPDLGYGDPSVSNKFQISWNGTNVLNATTVSNLPYWTNFLYFVTATSTTSTLQFGFQNYNSVFGFDFVNLTPLPTIQGVKKVGTNAVITWSSGLTNLYQVQYTTTLRATNTNTWINLGSITISTNFTTSVTDAIGTNSSRFYRVQLVQ